jgi:arsenate reductase (thioredoxin)
MNVLFLCTGNSARSILAEAILKSLPQAKGRFHAFSAGSQPRSVVNPLALDVLREHKIASEGLRSKSWEEFARPGAPTMDFVFTVCDQAAAETCPVWPGHPTTAHWGIADPAAVSGTEEERRRAFRDAFLALRRRIELFVALPLEKLSGYGLHEELATIGKHQTESGSPIS